MADGSSNESDMDAVMEVNLALGAMCIGFLFYLLLPKALQKHIFRAHRKRFVRSKYYNQNDYTSCADVPKHIATQRRSSYTSLGTKDHPGGGDDMTLFSGYSANNNNYFASACTPIEPLILNPSQACIVTTETLGFPGIDACSTFDSAGGSRNSRLFASTTIDPKTPTRLIIVDSSSSRMDQSDDIIAHQKAAVTSPDSVLDRSFAVDTTKKLLVLLSTKCLSKQQEADQKDAIALLKQRNVPYDIVDTLNPLQRSKREELYALSGIRAKLPQFFFQRDGNNNNNNNGVEYVGDWKMLQKIHHAEGLPKMFREANPHLSTWDEVFADTSQIFCV